MDSDAPDSDGSEALRSIELTVPTGQLLTIVGPSGCGKSTLLRCVAGLIRPTSGRVTLDGDPVDGVPERLGVVFQDYSRSLFPWLSVRENVALPLRRQGLRRSERHAAALRMLEQVGLADAGRRRPWQLSGGMQQRVALARALAARPSLLLMDEPFGALDARTREDLEDLLLRLHRAEGMTVLLVTHDIDESVYVGDRVVVLAPRPGPVHADLPVRLPAERDQIATRRLPEFIELRSEVGRAVRLGAAPEPEGRRDGAP
ncbi:ABC transporter ATP-binding protein [Streptomyces corynorhini]|uniref:ABC transporter ATP-binding protein n=2 Tax=Streptomyces corynorhini TaxID=2282652 RepID=A0A370BBT8_9ACTN|nr:ABC transporter ATP-binding protein [Streptomyces corynorhini]RDG36905.1 ABC transporter ATP-binding protein [Streptomyces corynorhini]